MLILGNAAAAGPLRDRLGPRASTLASAGLVCWSLPRTGGESVLGLHQTLLDGFGAMRDLLRSGEPQRLRRIVLVADAGPASSAGHVLSVAVGAFAKSLARELARHGVTVNALGGDLDAASDGWIDLIAYLAGEASGFVTGQALGPTGHRLGSEVAHPHAPIPVGSRVLVSGGAGAIGEAITRALHRDGYKVLIGHVTEGASARLARELDPTGATCATARCDVTDLDRIPQLVRELASSWPDLRGAVLCSGWNRTCPFAETSPDEWLRTLSVNFTGPALIAAEMADATGGPATIVAIGSESSRIGDGGRAVYAAAKAAVAAYMGRLAADRAGITAMTVAPGPIDTPLMRSTHGGPEEAEKGIARLARLIPLGRLGLPEDIAEAASLVFSEAGGALNGAILSVGGGITMQ